MMHELSITPLVSCDWLQENLARSDLIVLDASFFLPNQGRNAAEEFAREHIPGSRYFDIDAVADRGSSLPHMLPSPEQFAQAAGGLGIGNHTHVVAYDSNHFMASARAWWMFRVFGHDRVSVLDGGFRRWCAEGRPVDAEPVIPEARDFSAAFRPQLVADLARIRQVMDEPVAQIVDARSAGRFAGTEPEPRAGLRSGHIPGSLNLPYRDLVDEASFCLKPTEALQARFQTAGLDLARPVYTTCGTGVTAAILALGLYRLGKEDVAVYDGSWTEWGGREDTPVSTG